LKKVEDKMGEQNKIYLETYTSISKKYIDEKVSIHLMGNLDINKHMGSLIIDKIVNEKENSVLYKLEDNQQIKLQRYEGKIELLYDCNPKTINQLEDILKDIEEHIKND